MSKKSRSGDGEPKGSNKDGADDNQTSPPLPTKQRWWDRLSRGEKIAIVLGVPGLVAAIATPFISNHFDESRHRKDIRPKVVYDGEAILLEPLNCDAAMGNFKTGRLTRKVVNNGISDALNVTHHARPWPVLSVPYGLKDLEKPPTIDQRTCDEAIRPDGEKFTLPGHTAAVLDADFADGSFTREDGLAPQLDPNTPLQLYVKSCVFYSDEFGKQHATCDISRLHLPTRLSDQTEFRCTDGPIFGQFVQVPLGNCSN